MTTPRSAPIFSIIDGEPVAYIPLTRGLLAIVDLDNFEYLNQWRWRASKNNCSGYFYAVRTEGPRGSVRQYAMHRVVLGLEYGDPRLADHKITEHTLDNRRSNLRISTQEQNQANRGRPKSNTSGFKGVTWDKSKAKWQSIIRVHGRNKFLGRYDTPEAAHDAYCDAAKFYFGEFARTA